MGSVTSLTFAVHDDVPAEVDQVVDRELHASNRAAAPLDEVRGISCVARLPTGEIMGGVVGRTWGKCCEVQQVWVHADYRLQGIGTRLMNEVHRRAESRGCRTFYLETMGFQAPGFYRKLGYESRMEIGGFREGMIKYWMVREV